MKNETLKALAEIEFYEPLSTTVPGFVIPTITGSISFVSSSLILYIIYKRTNKKDVAPPKLLATYHRIMASMSAFDVISSTCVVLRQTFMPKDHMVYHFKGPTIGNSTTCRIQGWFVIFGVCGTTASTLCLCWYFVLSIVFKVDMKKIRKYIAPLMYIYILSVSVAVATFFTKIDMMNPNLTSGTCDIAPYPISCDEEKWWDWNECTWEEGVLETYFENQWVILYAILLQFVMIFIGMVLILCKSCQRRKRNDNKEKTTPKVTRNISDNFRGSDDGISQNEENQENESQEESEWQRGRVLIRQSLMYIGALVFTWLWFLLHYVHVNIYQLEYMNAIFFPLQGFWNLLIFLYDKTYLVQQAQPELGFFKAVIQILSSSSDTAMIVLADLSNVKIEPRFIDHEEPSKNDNSQGISYATSESKNENSQGISYDSKKVLSIYDSISEVRNTMSHTSNLMSNTSHAVLGMEDVSNYTDSKCSLTSNNNGNIVLKEPSRTYYEYYSQR